MSNQDEVVTKFKEELRRILDSETQSRKERIAAVRQQFHETISGLENEADSSSAVLGDRLENQLLTTMDPLWALSGLHADLTDKHEKLNVTAQQLEEENTLLRAQNAQTSERMAAVSEELLKKSELLDHVSQAHQELDQRMAGMEQELEQAKIDAAQRTREMLQRLLASCEHIEGKKSQVDILASFVDEAAQYASRVALFVAKSDMFLGWLSRGFHSVSFSDQDIKAVHFSVYDESALKEAYADRHPVVASRLSHPENKQIFERLGAPQKDSFVAMPLVLKDRSTAVLYADAGMGAEGACEAEALKLLVELVALSVELLAYHARAVALQYQGVHVGEKPSGAVPLPAHPAVETGVAVTATTAPDYFTPRQTSQPSPDKPPRPVEPQEVQDEPVPQEAPKALLSTEEESMLYNDAKRFARLLVSEIKFYNEQKVVDGRRNRDIYDRLKDDIDRSREMYNKRISAVVLRKVDYFYDELVRTLGENDPDVLGSDCPGPIIPES
jgi:hypothetical protein